MDEGLAFRYVGHGLRAGDHGVARDRGGQEDLVAPDDRRRVSAARDRRLPDHVLLRPLRGHVRGRGDALAVGPGPAGPARVWLDNRPGERRGDAGGETEEKSGDDASHAGLLDLTAKTPRLYGLAHSRAARPQNSDQRIGERRSM